jgi:hypothetical protein
MPPPRWIALAALGLTMGLLVPGLVLPVITVRGVLQPDGVAELAPKLLESSVSPEFITGLRPLINPAMLPLFEMSPGGLRGAIVKRFGEQVSAELRKGEPIEVYAQTRSILGSVRHLYQVGSTTAATLILLFSVIVPFVKATLVSWAVFQRAERRGPTLRLVSAIAKWSMADVFAVALFITYLAARATQTPPGSAAAPLVAFTASFGAGFYWFAAYCVVSLAVQQATARALGRDVAALRVS